MQKYTVLQNTKTAFFDRLLKIYSSRHIFVVSFKIRYCNDNSQQIQYRSRSVNPMFIGTPCIYQGRLNVNPMFIGTPCIYQGRLNVNTMFIGTPCIYQGRLNVNPMFIGTPYIYQGRLNVNPMFIGIPCIYQGRLNVNFLYFSTTKAAHPTLLFHTSQFLYRQVGQG